MKEAEAPQTELQQLLQEREVELDEADEKVSELEERNHDLQNDKEHLQKANRYDCRL